MDELFCATVQEECRFFPGLAYDELVRIIKRPISLAVVKERELIQGIDKIYQHGHEIQSLASEMVDDIGENVFDIQQLNRSVASSEAPVVKLIETMFQDAIKTTGLEEQLNVKALIELVHEALAL